MTSVNLLSPSVRHGRQRSRRIRRWTLVLCMVGVGAAIPMAIDFVHRTRGASLERRIDPLEKKLAETRKKLTDTSRQCEHLAMQLARADALRSKRSWAGMLALIAARTPEEVWLSEIQSIETERHRTPAPVAPQAAPADTEKTVMLDGPGAVRISGFAVDHDWLYEFITRLKDASVFERVDMLQAGKEKTMQADAVRFVLVCAW